MSVTWKYGGGLAGRLLLREGPLNGTGTPRRRCRFGPVGIVGNSRPLALRRRIEYLTVAAARCLGSLGQTTAAALVANASQQSDRQGRCSAGVRSASTGSAQSECALPMNCGNTLTCRRS